MAISPWLAGAQLGIGALGMFQQNDLANQQAGYYKQAAGVLGSQNEAYKRGLNIAENYDPLKETQGAVDYAGRVSADNLTKALTGLNQQFAASGGNPAGDSAFRVNAQGAANRVADPLKEWAANQYAQQTQLKLGALSSAVGNGGGLAQGFQQLAAGSQPNYGPAASMLSGGINSLAQMQAGRAGSSGLTSGPGVTSQNPLGVPGGGDPSNAALGNPLSPYKQQRQIS